MKNILILLIFLLGVSPLLIGQKAIYGNKEITTETRKVKAFTEVEIELNGHIEIHSGEQTRVVIETDQNLHDFIVTKVEQHRLLITQRDWPEPSQKFIIHVYTPTIHTIVSDSWADIVYENIQVDRLTLSVEQGCITASGEAKELQISSEQAVFKLENLAVQHAEIDLKRRAEVTLCCAEEVVKTISDRSSLVILSDNNQVGIKEDKKQAEYVTFKIVNNSWRLQSFYVKGPKWRAFSYGFTMVPGFSRHENWPVGTQVFTDSATRDSISRLTVTADMKGKSINIFKK